MNAFELADLIGLCGDGGYNQDAANMLRQQADRIAELEKDLKKYDQLAWDDLNKSKTIWCDCGDSITADSGAKCGICASTTPQTKPLSDEEISQVYKEISEPFGEKRLYEIHDFARAIEERHGIK